MQLFNASAMINEKNIAELLKYNDDPKKLKNIIIEAKLNLLKSYKFKVFNIPQDFNTKSYIIAANHLTDSDAPLIMSFYYEIMHKVTDGYPRLFVFAKENCFNGVSIPKELIPILQLENVFAVNRNSVTGSMNAIKAAEKWFNQNEKAKHFLIFSQGTIYDINKEKVEDIERGAFWLAKILNIPVLPAFIEQAVEGEDNRMIFGNPILIPNGCRDFDLYKKQWLEDVIESQNVLESLTGKPARQAILDVDHQIRKRSRNTNHAK